ncbi:hypothetical protein [Rahnella sikkimica]|uniref:Uncharacterized protein n=1 Tax=Rahnella sikkimica TaxID=1805933 RepID=A0A2L1UZ63_9GAMM|nr:hypothetical protein [Rahnella sikkimica]AVF38184.1 hypothetical protein BV494_25225 [Rahnella sikkimica]
MKTTTRNGCAKAATTERRGGLSAGGGITGSSGGAAFGRCKPAVASGWKPAGRARRGRDSLLALFTTAVPAG